MAQHTDSLNLLPFWFVFNCRRSIWKCWAKSKEKSPNNATPNQLCGRMYQSSKFIWKKNSPNIEDTLLYWNNKLAFVLLRDISMMNKLIREFSMRSSFPFNWTENLFYALNSFDLLTKLNRMLTWQSTIFKVHIWERSHCCHNVNSVSKLQHSNYAILSNGLQFKLIIWNALRVLIMQDSSAILMLAYFWYVCSVEYAVSLWRMKNKIAPNIEQSTVDCNSLTCWLTRIVLDSNSQKFHCFHTIWLELDMIISMEEAEAQFSIPRYDKIDDFDINLISWWLFWKCIKKDV